jgi:hypothetical protein
MCTCGAHIRPAGSADSTRPTDRLDRSTPVATPPARSTGSDGHHGFRSAPVRAPEQTISPPGRRICWTDPCSTACASRPGVAVRIRSVSPRDGRVPLLLGSVICRPLVPEPVKLIDPAAREPGGTARLSCVPVGLADPPTLAPRLSPTRRFRIAGIPPDSDRPIDHRDRQPLSPCPGHVRSRRARRVDRPLTFRF